ncbi:hypothetical protein L207DRAFT_522235 [Hyaloscypha variabilis F]|uniref:2EXR domain-containing protein n=1 Tax=Hyaloscypha variabilis (strain UAMH 11265 / GT02V1 / F) TaxID=1149755 RepID=A0A2J6SDT8_HYAVF|nr:hypothetical protein L207DRAFT_522235 [Hyaloscypha variabilis F]
MASSEEATNNPKDTDVEGIDSWKSWREVGEAQLRGFWRVTAKPMYYSHDGSCKNYLAAREHPMAITRAFPVIIEQATCENFRSFPLLPLELKCKIWRHALPESRILELANRGALPGYITYFAVVPLSGGYNSNKRNLRNIMRALRHLSRVCGIRSTELELSDIGNTTEVSFYSEYFDSKRDTLLLHIASIHELYWESAWLDLSEIRNIVVYHDPRTYNLQSTAEFQDEWPDLKSLQVVLDSRNLNFHLSAVSEVSRLVQIQNLEDLDLIFTRSFNRTYAPSGFSSQSCASQLRLLKRECKASRV